MKRIAILASSIQRNRWALLIFSCLGLGIAGIFMHNLGHESSPDGKKNLVWEILGNSLMLAGACFFVGALIGFLFGIPRTVQGNNSQDDEVDYRINTKSGADI